MRVMQVVDLLVCYGKPKLLNLSLLKRVQHILDFLPDTLIIINLSAL